jgi:PTS system fructose-specific IIA component/PTS system nitrogen regulatory IIA component
VGLAEFLIPDAIITDLVATTKEAAIREIVRTVQDAGYLAQADTEELVRAFMKREELASTGIGQGVGCPHGGHPAVNRAFGTVALSRPGVAFDACDGEPVHVIFLLFHTPDQFARRPIKPCEIYDAFNAIMLLFRNDRLLDHLRWCHSREEVMTLIAEGDRAAIGAQPYWWPNA